MNWDGHQLRFDSQEGLRDYMFARLSGSSLTPPPVQEELGINPEDILIQYYRHGTLSQSDKNEFWTVWKDVTSEFRRDKSSEAFRNATALAEALTAPNIAESVTDFLPKNADEYEWSKHSDHDQQERILRLFFSWQLIPEGDPFWRSAFDGYLLCIEKTTEHLIPRAEVPPLIAAYKGMGTLTENDIESLLFSISRHGSEVIEQQIIAMCEDQYFRYMQQDAPSVAALRDDIREAFDKVAISTLSVEWSEDFRNCFVASTPQSPNGQSLRILRPDDHPRTTAVSNACLLAAA